MADFRDPALLENNPFVSEGMKRRAVAADAPAQTTVETYDPYKGNWAAETARAVTARQANNLTGMESLARGLVGDQEGQRAAARRYMEREAQIRELGPQVQSFEDAQAAGGGVGDYASALGFQAANIGADFGTSILGGGIGGALAKKGAQRMVRREIERDLTEFAGKRGVADEAQRTATRKATMDVVQRSDALADAGKAMAPSQRAGEVAKAMRVASAQADEALAKDIKRRATVLTGRTPLDADRIDKLTRYGVRAGAAAGAVPGINSGNQELLANENTDQGDAWKLASGVAAGAATALLPVERFLGQFGDEAVAAARQQTQKYLPRMLKEAGLQGSAEGAQEVMQQATQLASHHFVDSNIGVLDDRAIDQYMGSFLGGFFAGGAIGAAGETGRSAAHLMSSGARKVLDAGGNLRDVLRERIGERAAAKREAEAKRPKPGEPMGDAPDTGGLFRQARDMAGKAGDAVGSMMESAKRFAGFNEDLDLDDRVERVYRAWEQTGTPMIVGQRYGRLPGRADNLPGLQRYLMGYVNPDSPIWADDGLTQRTGEALERLFRGAPNQKVAARDQALLDALVEGGRIEQTTLDSMRALAPEWAERAAQAEQFEAGDETVPAAATDDPQGTMAEQLRAAYAQRDANAQAAQADAGGGYRPDDISGSTSEDQGAEGDLVNDVLTEGQGKVGGADLLPAERLATARRNLRAVRERNANADEAVGNDKERKAATKEFREAKAALRRSLLAGDGRSGNSSVFVANESTPGGRAEWRKVQAETRRSPNRIEIEPVNVGDRKEMMRGRALSLDTLVARYVNQVDGYDTANKRGQDQRARAALFQVFADLKSAGIKLNPQTITPGWLGNKGRANNGTFIGKLTPADAAELRAMWDPNQVPKDKAAARRQAERARQQGKADDLAAINEERAARGAKPLEPREVKPPVSGEKRQERLDREYGKDDDAPTRDAPRQLENGRTQGDASARAPKRGKAHGEHEIDSANADTLRLQDPNTVQFKPMKAPPGAKVTEGTRAKEDPKRPGKNAPLDQSYVSTQGVAEVRGSDELGDIARAARKEAVDQGLASPEDMGPDGKPNTLTKIVGDKVLRPQPPSKRVAPQADPRFKAGVQIGQKLLQAEYDNATISDKRYENQLARLTDPDSGLAMKFYNDAYHGKYVKASVVEQKADPKVDEQVDREALRDERRAERERAKAEAAKAGPDDEVVEGNGVGLSDPNWQPRSRAGKPLSEARKSALQRKADRQNAKAEALAKARDDFADDIESIANGGEHDLAREQDMLNAMLDRLGIKDKITLHPLEGKKGGNYRPSTGEVRINPSLTGAERVEVLMHELGHHIVFAKMAEAAGISIKDLPLGKDPASVRKRFEALKKADPKLYDALMADYNAWKQANPRSQSGYVTRASRAPLHRANTVLAKGFKEGNPSADELSADSVRDLYLFDEYLADHIARALTTRKEGRSVIGKFFKDIADALREAWRMMTGAEKREWAPAPSVDAWIKSLFDANKDAVKQATGVSVPAKAAKQAVKAAATEQASAKLGGPVEYTRANVRELLDFIKHTLPADERLLLEKVLGRPAADAAIREHFAGHDVLLNQLDNARNSLEWRLALGYLAWRDGALTQTGPRGKQLFFDLREDLLKVAGLAGDADIALRVLEDIADGTVQRYKDAGKTYNARRIEGRARGNLQKALNWVSEKGPISNGLAVFWTGINQRLRDAGVPALRDLAATLQRPQGSTDENDDRGLIPAIRAAQLKTHTRVTKLFDGLDDGQSRRVLDLLQRGAKAGDDAYDSRSEKVRNAVDGMRALLREEHALGTEFGMFGEEGQRRIKDYFPVVMDLRHEHARERLTKLYAQDKFRDAIFKHFNQDPNEPQTDEAHARLVKRLVDAAANDEMETVVGNGDLILGTRSQSARLSDFIYKLGDDKDKQVFASLQSKNIDEIYARHFAPMAKTIEFRRRFGEWVEVDNDVGEGTHMEYNARGRLDAKLADARKQGASDEDLKLAENAVKAAMGTYGMDVSPVLNAINPALAKKFSGPKTKAFVQGAQAYENVRLLPLALLSSLVDPMGIAVRSGGGFVETWKGVREGMRRFTNKEAAADALRMLEELGLADDFMPAIASHPMFDGPESPLARKVNEKVFKWNGMNAWVQSTRVMAAHAGHAFLLKHAKIEGPHSKRYLAELALTPADIQPDPQRPGRVVINDKTRAALQQFVDEAILRPNAMQAPLWHRDPYVGIITQYKSFAYAIYDQITSRIGIEFNNGNYRVLLAAMAYLPIVLIGELIREFIQHGSDGNPQRKEWGADDYAMMAAARTGLMGPQFEVTSDVQDDIERKQLPGTSQLGPTATQAKNLGDALQGRRDLGKEFETALPASSLWKRWNDEPATAEA